MPSVELSKLQSVTAARGATASDRAQIEARASTPGTTVAGAPGISLEVNAASAAAVPPVDQERVQQIKDALREGSYPLVPTKIADAMIAAQISLSIPERS